MAYDDRFGDDNRWRDRDREGNRDRDYGRQGRSWEDGRREESGWGRGWSGDRGRDEDRGFFEKAREEVRSWFGDEDDHRRGHERSRRDNGWRDRDDDRSRSGSDGWMSGGWNNQSGDAWNRDRPGVRDQEREGWFSDSRGGERGERLGGTGFGGGDYDRRFDRVDAGSTGTHAAHPMTAPIGGSGGYAGGFGGGSSSARYAAYRNERGGGRGEGLHDPHYSEWRRRQIDDLDRDYDEYRREHQSKFEQEFGSWRSKRQGQRRMLNKVDEQMEVVGSDGSHVGTVDKVRGDRIILTKSDENAGGMHHSVPCSWVESIDDGKVALNKSAEEAMNEWRDEERNRALFEREESGSPGPHALNRSFSGTYSDDDR